jgi:uncharacterized protein (DUF2267 family)
MKNRFESERRFIERLVEVAPFANQAEAARAARALLQVLGGLLTQDERVALARELPAELVRLLAIGLPQPNVDWTEFHRRVAQVEGVPLALAIEHSEVVCRALCEALAPSTRQHLQTTLPKLAGLFELPTDIERPLSEAHRSSSAPNDLAEGRPGGASPIATSDLRSLAHRHSVARSDDPHADTKLSSARGLRQEQGEHTLAAGRPGSRRPISGSR